MAERLWRRRWSTAAAALLGACGLLVVLDGLTRPVAPPRLLSVLGLMLLAGSVVNWFIPWDRIRPSYRLLPAASVIVTLGIAIFGADIDRSPGAPVGLATFAALVMTYVGFVSNPGMSLALSPVVLLALLVAYWREPERLGLALPLVAVPASALLAELVSLLHDRTDEASQLNRRRAERFARLEHVLRRFSRPSSIEAAARQVAGAAREIFEVDRTTVVLRDRDDRLIPVTDGPPSPHDPTSDVARLVAEAIQGDQPTFVPTREGATMLVLPLPAKDAPAGAVLAYPIAPDDPVYTLDLARLFGVQIGIAIEHLYLIHELTEASRVDELTGIGNRRHADALLASLVPGDALVLIDLDGFKAINDTFGHPAGDQLLQTLSAHLRACLRDSDTSARLGGDEFLIVARRAHADPLAVARRILDGWDYQRHRSAGPTPTLSAGVALHEAGRTSADTFDRADQALYEAKRRGKNQAQLWDQAIGRRASGQRR